MKEPIIIVAPHPDDEIIGCFEALSSGKVSHILVSERVHEAEPLERFFNLKVSLYTLTNLKALATKNMTLMFPDPIFEFHPTHRMIGTEGEWLAREGYDVVFYSVNMQAPYVHEVLNPARKKDTLDNVYPFKKSLWQFDHKYFLFEGHCKWLF